MASIRTNTLLSTDLDEGYVQSERRRIFEELAIWNETDKSGQGQGQGQGQG